MAWAIPPMRRSTMKLLNNDYFDNMGLGEIHAKVQAGDRNNFV